MPDVCVVARSSSVLVQAILLFFFTAIVSVAKILVPRPMFHGNGTWPSAVCIHAVRALLSLGASEALRMPASVRTRRSGPTQQPTDSAAEPQPTRSRRASPRAHRTARRSARVFHFTGVFGRGSGSMRAGDGRRVRRRSTSRCALRLDGCARKTRDTRRPRRDAPSRPSRASNRDSPPIPRF